MLGSIGINRNRAESRISPLILEKRFWLRALAFMVLPDDSVLMVLPDDRVKKGHEH
jgi:hypothetical protein